MKQRAETVIEQPPEIKRDFRPPPQDEYSMSMSIQEETKLSDFNTAVLVR